MDVQEFATELRVALGGQDVGFSLTQSATEVLEHLGPRWLAAAMKPVLLVNQGRMQHFELHTEGDEPMRNLAECGGGPRRGIAVVGSGERAPRAAHLTLPTPEILAGETSFSFGQRPNFVAKTISAIYTRAYWQVPLALDSYRQWRNKRAGGRVRGEQMTTVPMRQHADVAGRTMWIAMHWAESGGAESWAWEQARLAKEAGFALVITFDRAAPQRQLAKAFALTDDVYLVGNSLERPHWPLFVAELLRKHDISHLHIHHSELAYAALALLRLTHPQIRVEDSTHIVEHRGGGFVGTSIELSDYLDLHHVISPQLVDLYTANGVDPAKLAFHPLTGFSADAPLPRTSRGGGPLRVGFLGRLSAQKRPYLFQRTAAACKLAGGNDLRFIMQGAGELEKMVERDQRRLRLESYVERRDWAPVAGFLADVDVLLVTSENEGLTLTALEANAAGVLVVSADVGSQRSVVADAALLPAQPVQFVSQAVRLLRALAKDEALFASLLAQQGRKVEQIAAQQSASEFYAQHYQEVLAR